MAPALLPCDELGVPVAPPPGGAGDEHRGDGRHGAGGLTGRLLADRRPRRYLLGRPGSRRAAYRDSGFAGRGQERHAPADPRRQGRPHRRGEALARPDLDDYVAVERGRPGELELLIEPQSDDELAALIRALREHRIATCTVAGQSGLVEAQRPHGVAIGMKRFGRVHEMILADGTRAAPADFAAATAGRAVAALRGARVRVGAGVPIDAVNEALAPAGLKLPIVMGSTASASAGACAANGSAGANAVRYGTAADLVRHVRGVLGTGEIVAEDVAPRPPARDPERCAIRSDRFLRGTRSWARRARSASSPR